MQKEKLEPLSRNNQGSEFIIKEDYKYSILQWRYKKKLDRLLEKLQTRT